MPTSTITSKGQITIPKKVRERLHLREGDRLEFCVEEDGSLKLYPITKTVEEVFGAFSLKGRKARSASEIRRDLRKAFETGKV